MAPTSDINNSAHPSNSSIDSLQMLIDAQIALHQQALENFMTSQPTFNGCPQGVMNRQPMMFPLNGVVHPMVHGNYHNGAHVAPAHQHAPSCQHAPVRHHEPVHHHSPAHHHHGQHQKPANVGNAKASVHNAQSAAPTATATTNHAIPIPFNLPVPMMSPVAFYCAPTLSHSLNGRQPQIERAYNPPHDLTGVESSKAFVSMKDLRQRVLDAIQQLKATELRENEDLLSANSSFSVVSDKNTLEQLPMKAQEFLLAVQKSRQAKESTTSSDAQKTSEAKNTSAQSDSVVSEIDSAFIQKHFEQQMSLQKQILELLQPRNLDHFPLLAEPMSYKIALERLKALKPEEPSAPQTKPKNASLVFIYDIEDITHLSMKILRGFRRLFPELKDISRAIEGVFSLFTSKFFEYSEDFDFDTVMNIKDGHFGTKLSEFLEFKNKCEISGPNIIYELIKAREENTKAREDVFRAQLDSTKVNEQMLKALGMNTQKVELQQVVEFQKLFDQLWQSSKRCLQAISNKSLKNTYDNVVLCEMLGYGSAQLLLSGLASEVPMENLYSLRRSSKEAVLERIQRDYGNDCLLVVVTSNPKTISAAEKKNILVWPVDSADSFDELYAAQQSQLLK